MSMMCKGERLQQPSGGLRVLQSKGLTWHEIASGFVAEACKKKVLLYTERDTHEMCQRRPTATYRRSTKLCIRNSSSFGENTDQGAPRRGCVLLVKLEAVEIVAKHERWVLLTELLERFLINTARRTVDVYRKP